MEESDDDATGNGTDGTLPAAAFVPTMKAPTPATEFGVRAKSGRCRDSQCASDGLVALAAGVGGDFSGTDLERRIASTIRNALLGQSEAAHVGHMSDPLNRCFEPHTRNRLQQFEQRRTSYDLTVIGRDLHGSQTGERELAGLAFVGV